MKINNDLLPYSQVLPEDEESNVQEDDLPFSVNELPMRFDCGSSTNLDLPAEQNRAGINQNPNSLPRLILITVQFYSIRQLLTGMVI